MGLALENFKGRDNYSEIKKCVEVVRILHDKVIKSLGSYDFEMKYSKTDSPSLKFEVIGDSIISPTPPFIDF